MLTVSTGLPALDDLLDGGFPLSRLTEISGPADCTARVAAACLVACQRQVPDRHVIYLDAADQLDAAQLAAWGVDLARLLIVSPSTHADLSRQEARLSERVAGYIISGMPGWATHVPHIYAYIRLLARLIRETQLFLVHLVAASAVVPAAARAAAVRVHLAPRVAPGPMPQANAVLLKHPYLPTCRVAQLALFE